MIINVNISERRACRFAVCLGRVAVKQYPSGHPVLTSMVIGVQAVQPDFQLCVSTSLIRCALRIGNIASTHLQMCCSAALASPAAVQMVRFAGARADFALQGEKHAK